MKGFLCYLPGNSLLHRLNPLTKLFLPFMICISCFLTDNILALLALLLFDLLLGGVGGIFKQTFAIFKGLVKISVFLFVIQLLFIQKGNVLIQLPLYIVITDYGIHLAIVVVLRLIGATLPLALLLSVTQMNDLSNAMVQTLHIPYKYSFALTSAIHFVPTFAQDMQLIIEAQTARGVQLDTKNIFKKIKLIFPLCVPLLISSVRKTEGAAIATELRGFNLRTKSSCYKKSTFSYLDIMALGVGIIVIAVGVLF